MKEADKTIVRRKYLKGELQLSDIPDLLDAQVRQVRWLYKNSNKCTRVFEEKMVRLVVAKLQNRINQLENK